MEWIAVIISLEICIMFFLRYIKQEKELRNLQELGYFAIFLGFSFMWFFYVLSDYYAPTDFWRYLLLNFGYFSIILGTCFFSLYMEKYKVFLFKKHLFTIIFFSFFIGFVILFFIDMRITQPIIYGFAFTFVFFLLIYLIDFIKKVHNKERLLFGIIKYLSGVGLILIGFMFTTDALIELFGLEVRIIGAASQLIGFALLSFFFITLPPFSEFDWQDKIESLFLINEAGLCMYYKMFQEKEELMDENLISAAITSVQVLLEKLTGTEQRKGFSVFKKKGQIITIYPGKIVNGVLYTSEDLNFPKKLLKDFLMKFEQLYKNVLTDWNGDRAIFKAAEIIVDDLFCK